MLYNENEVPFRSECTPVADGSTWYKLTELKSCLAADHKTLGQDARIAEQADATPSPQPSGKPATDPDAATHGAGKGTGAGQASSTTNARPTSLARTGSSVTVFVVLTVGLMLIGVSLNVWRMRR